MTEREHVWRMLDGTEVEVPVADQEDGWSLPAHLLAPLPLHPRHTAELLRRNTILRALAGDDRCGAVLPPLPRAFARLLNEERAGR